MVTKPHTKINIKGSSIFAFGTVFLGNSWVLPTLNENNQSYKFVIGNLKSSKEAKINLIGQRSFTNWQVFGILLSNIDILWTTLFPLLSKQFVNDPLKCAIVTPKMDDPHTFSSIFLTYELISNTWCYYIYLGQTLDQFFSQEW